MIHDATRGDCSEAPRTERTTWTSDPDVVTCTICRGRTA